MDTSTVASSTLPLYDAATSTIESPSRGTFVFMFNVYITGRMYVYV